MRPVWDTSRRDPPSDCLHVDAHASREFLSRDAELKGWYATRRERLTSIEYHAGLFRTLAADDPNGLRLQLELQTEIQSRR
jgi:hypothetical protein